MRHRPLICSTRPDTTSTRSYMLVSGIVPNTGVQGAIYAIESKARNKAVMKTLDSVNAYMGRDTVRFAAQGYSNAWMLKAEHLSRCYTTQLDHIIRIQD